MLDELPKHLYHYTGAGGLYGILTSKVVWATHIAYLNDMREAFYGAEQAVKHIDTIWKTMTDEKDKFSNCEALKAAFGDLRTVSELVEPFVHGRTGMYVTCLSREGDLLSQWRGYGGDGGYAIKFDAKQLKKSLKRVPGRPKGSKQSFDVRIWEIEYDNERFHQDVIKVIEPMAQDLQNPDLPKTPGAADSIVKNAKAKILALSLYLKDPAFREEREYRINTRVQTGPVNDAADACHYYPGKLGLVPRIHLSFAPSSIKEIIVGPGDFGPSRKASVEHFVSTHPQYAGVKVESSSIPFRSI
jgi:hypothetical protein